MKVQLNEKNNGVKETSATVIKENTINSQVSHQEKIAQLNSYGSVNQADMWYIDPKKSRDKDLTLAKFEWFWNTKYKEQDFRTIECKVEWVKCLKTDPERFECDCKRGDNGEIVHIRCMGCTTKELFYEIDEQLKFMLLAPLLQKKEILSNKLMMKNNNKKQQ
jgi:hypothetical protein